MAANKGGRPLKKIGKQEFEKLCALQCTKSEICGFFEITDKTLENWCKRTYTDDKGNPLGFSEVFSIKRVKGKISLRRAQFQLAEKSASMAIFLGKNYLEQRDVPKEERNEALESLRTILQGIDAVARDE